jgi:hypothetical protein
MKTSLSITLAAIAAFTGSAFAGTPVKTVVPAEPEFYRAGEFQGSVSFLGGAKSGGTRAVGPLAGPASAWTNSTAPGVDAELRYFVTRNFGLGLEGEWLNTRRTLFGSALNFYLRAPLNQHSRWAPYLFTGIGGLYGGGGNAFLEGHIGGGLEYRITPNVGLLGDGRYEWVDATRNSVPQFGAMRLGVNFVF